MNEKLAIDFGTTNTVIARWNEPSATAELIDLPHLSWATTQEYLPVVPSLLYVRDGQAGQVVVGQAVRVEGLDRQRDNRLFRNFKRGIVASPAPAPRPIDGVLWEDRAAGRSFIRQLLAANPCQQADLDQLVLTAPVVAFEGYLNWLKEVMVGFAPEKIRVVDEPTAAALGYAVTEPGAVVLVFDFGGGTLDLSLVRLPESRTKTGGFLSRLKRQSLPEHTAQVIAKAGRVIGGSDIDQWLLADVLARLNLTPAALGSDYAALLTRCEQAKIALSTVDSTELGFSIDGRAYELTLTRAEMEASLAKNGFFVALRRVVDKVMYVARQQAIFKEDIRYVLLVGGASLMPSVRALLRQYFTETAVRADKPFTAVAEGALQVAAGYGLEDYLIHGYGLRHLDPLTNRHQYDEIIPMGSRYPTSKSVEMLLGAAHEQQAAIEFVIGQINTEAVAMIEVKYEDGQAVFVAQADQQAEQIVPLNGERAGQAPAQLRPPGRPGQDRLQARFAVDENRQLRLTVLDLQTGKELLKDVALATLR